MGGQVARRDGQPLPGHDEDQEPALGQISRAVGDEGMFDAFVLRVVVVRRVDQGEAEGPVGDGGLEQVGGDGAVEQPLGLLRPVAVQLHAVGLDGKRAPSAEFLRPAAPARPRPRSRGRGCAASRGCGGGSRTGSRSAPRSGPTTRSGVG